MWDRDLVYASLLRGCAVNPLSRIDLRGQNYAFRVPQADLLLFRDSILKDDFSSTFPDDSFKDLYIDSSNASLNDPFQSTEGINRSNEHLVHSISRLLDQNRPLIVSISRQWSMNDELESGKTPLYREQRSISDTTAMELTISRHQSFDSSSPMVRN